MALKALSKFSDGWYTPKSEEQEPEPRTRFKLRMLSGVQYLEVIEVMASGMRTGGQRLALRHALTDWENFLSPEDGQPLKFETSIDDNIARLHWDLITELSKEVLARSQIESTERKN